MGDHGPGPEVAAGEEVEAEEAQVQADGFLEPHRGLAQGLQIAQRQTPQARLLGKAGTASGGAAVPATEQQAD